MVGIQGNLELRDTMDIVSHKALNFKVRQQKRYLHSMVKREFPWLLGEDTI